MFKKLKDESGLTLIESLAVVVIIGIILGIGIPFIANIVKDSSTQDFVSNAKSLEDATHMYYRDNGEMPSLVVSEKEDFKNSITKDSKKIIQNEIAKAGVANSEQIVEFLLGDNSKGELYIEPIDYKKLKEYTKVTEGDEGTEEFLVVKMLDFDQNFTPADITALGAYENDISGFVFSKDIRSTSTKLMYSGAHKLEDGQPITDVESPKYNNAGNMTPYGFRLVSVTDNKDGTAKAEVSWTNRVVDDNGDILRGYIISKFDLNCDNCTSVNMNPDSLGATIVGNISNSNVNLTLKGTEVTYANQPLVEDPKETKAVNLPVDLVKEITNNDKCTTSPVSGSESFKEIVNPSDCYEVNDLFKDLQESATFNASNVTVVEDGLRLTGLTVGDYIVLKEVVKQGSSYDYDKNRTRLFIASANTELIPKNPYLQKDFQVNTKSNYLYIIEVYKNIPCANNETTTCESKKAPENAVEVFYE